MERIQFVDKEGPLIERLTVDATNGLVVVQRVSPGNQAMGPATTRRLRQRSGQVGPALRRHVPRQDFVADWTILAIQPEDGAAAVLAVQTGNYTGDRK